MVIVYHELLEEWGEVQVATGAMSPYLAMWPIYFAFLGLGIYLFRMTAEHPGGYSAFSVEQWISDWSQSSLAWMRRLRHQSS